MVKRQPVKYEKKSKLNVIKPEKRAKNSKRHKGENIKLILKDRLTKSECPLNINVQHVKTAIDGIYKLTKETASKKLFDDEYPIFLQITSIKIPNCPDRILRLPLKTSLMTDASEICLIVADLQKGRRVDYNPTVEHYENILKENGVTNINKIIPINCIKTEYDQFELKRRLVGQYDLFLADGKICGHLSHLLGKIFYKNRKLPTPIRLLRSDMKRSIQDAIHKTQLHLHSRGNTFLTQIGHSKMSTENIVSNLMSVAEGLSEFPGGCDNIRSLHIKSHMSIAVPIYMTLKNANEVKTPKVLGKRPKLFKEVTGELTTKLDSNVTLLASGEISVTKAKKNFVSLK